MPRTRNVFDPSSQKPFKLSRSKLELFLQCPRCFYIDRRLGIDRVSGPPFTLNAATDTLLAVPFQHPDIDVRRENFKGIRRAAPHPKHPKHSTACSASASALISHLSKTPHGAPGMVGHPFRGSSRGPSIGTGTSDALFAQSSRSFAPEGFRSVQWNLLDLPKMKSGRFCPTYSKAFKGSARESGSDPQRRIISRHICPSNSQRKRGFPPAWEPVLSQASPH